MNLQIYTRMKIELCMSISEIDLGKFLITKMFLLMKEIFTG